MKKLLSLIFASILLLALPAISLAETQDDLEAAYQEANAFYKAGDYAQAREALDALVEKGYGKACSLNGKGYINGCFTADGEPDYTAAYEWYNKSVEMGYGKAYLQIGVMYYHKYTSLYRI